jgi:hypothetical protein
MFALELNDALLVLAARPADGAAGLVARAPGVASVSDAGVLTGAAAAALAKLQPLRLQQRYWQDLGSKPLGRAPQPQLSAADLAYEQLRVLLDGARAPLLLAVPPGCDRTQLGLLLGIAAEAGAVEIGLVDAALAACALTPLPPQVVHLELHRHQAVATVIEQAGSGARRARYECDLESGTLRLEQLCMDLLAAQCVRQTRFDPRHEAHAEQQLANVISGCLQQLAQADSASIGLPTGSDTVQIELRQAQWLAAADPVYAALLRLVQRARPAGQPIELRLGARAHGFPGLAERLQALNACELTLLPEGAAALGALQWSASILRGSEPVLVQQLPLPLRPGATSPSAAITAAAPEQAATHIVHAGRAWLLHADPLTIGTAVPAGQRALPLAAGLPGVSRVHCRVSNRAGVASVADLSTYGTFINDERVHGTATLRRGDRLRLGTPGVTLDLVGLVDG